MRVEYLDHFGNDLAIVNAARVSMDKHHVEFDAESDTRLIAYLAREGHWTPFAHPQITLRITAPIFVARQLVKHQVGLCVSGDTEVTFVKIVKGVSNGVRRTKISDLYKMWSGGSKYHAIKGGRYQVGRGHLRVLNTETGRFETGKVIDVQKTGVKPVFELTTESGKSLKLTEDHQIFTKQGWMSLSEAVGLNVSASGTATMSKVCFIGANGVPIAGNGLYRDKEWMSAQRQAGKSLTQIAESANCTPHTIRKWLKRHQLQYNPLENLSGVNGRPPWNKEKHGYTLNRVFSEEHKQVLRDLHSGEKSNFWRGGVHTPTERSDIYQWVGRVAKKCHRKHGFTCQKCGASKVKLCAHHVVPCYSRPDLAYEFDNLASVCVPCHKSIHSSPESEVAFAEELATKGIVVADFSSRKKQAGRLEGNPLAVHFEKILKIKLVGEEDVYDLTTDNKNHNFVANGLVVHNCWSEVSRRYVESPPEFYEPDTWRARPENGIKQGSGVAMDDKNQIHADRVYRHIVQSAKNAYADLLTLGVCPEQARAVLPLSTYTSWIWTGSLAAYARICKLRLDSHAQAETREIAQHIAAIIQPLFPVSWPALMAEK